MAVTQLRPMLERRLRAGDLAAWKIALGLRRHTDGALLEDLDGDIAAAIGAQPGPYLRAARDFGGSGSLALASFMGERFVDAPLGVRCAALLARQAALVSVTEPELAELRAEAVQLLEPSVAACK